MRRLFLLLCLWAIGLGTIAATFSYEKTTVKIYPDLEGNAHIVEKIEIKIEGEDSINAYDNNIAITNDITSWKSRTGIDEIRYHINANIAPISNLRIIPLPKKRLSIINPAYTGILQIEYDVSGLFNKTLVKARTYHYTIEKDALSFTTNNKGDIVLNENDYLYIIIPDESEIVSVDPLSQNIDVLDKNEKEFFWKGKTTLEDFRFIYLHKISLSDEVEQYFIFIRDQFNAFIFSKEGTYLGIMIVLIIATYMLLKSKVKNNE